MLPSSSCLGFTMTVVCCRCADNVKSRFDGLRLFEVENPPTLPYRVVDVEIPGVKKSRAGGAVYRHLLGAICRNIRANDVVVPT
jgi:hypothetical protein